MYWIWSIMLLIVLCAIAYVAWNYLQIKKLSEGNEEMIELSSIIRSGARTFIRTEYRTVAVVVVILALLFSLFIEKTAGLTFIIGALMSTFVCIVGMRSATYANVRTTNRALETKSIGETVKVALQGGSISGLSVQAFGLLGLLLILFIWKIDPTAAGSGFVAKVAGVKASLIRISTYSLGCSLVAMFNRVAGGNYTKAADISSDILAKVRNDLPEDDSRIPNVIADFIGDNVNDIAGNCSDLLESFVATMSATIMIAVSYINEGNIQDSTFLHAHLYPILLAGLGLLGCLGGLASAQFKKKMSDDPSMELNLATWISAGATLVFGFFAALILFAGKGSVAELKNMGFKWGFISPWICTALGILSGVLIGSITEYYTSTSHNIIQDLVDKCKKLLKQGGEDGKLVTPTSQLAEMATEGEAFVVTKGDAIGSRSCLLPILLIGLSLFVSGAICGTYGIAVASLGMLAFVGATVSIDAFGPIADNAGGIAEACHLEEDVRAITDKLDAVGNTTAAIGKGFAIGSAAFATVSLIVAYVENCSVKIAIDFSSYVVVAGGIIGGALVEYFSAMLTDNTIESAKKMADQGDAILTSKPGVLDENSP